MTDLCLFSSEMLNILASQRDDEMLRVHFNYWFQSRQLGPYLLFTFILLLLSSVFVHVARGLQGLLRCYLWGWDVIPELRGDTTCKPQIDQISVNFDVSHTSHLSGLQNNVYRPCLCIKCPVIILITEFWLWWPKEFVPPLPTMRKWMLKSYGNNSLHLKLD